MHLCSSSIMFPYSIKLVPVTSGRKECILDSDCRPHFLIK
jgi:hypothetical protein